VTFEIGRQYVLNLAFTQNGTDGVDLGAKITFGDFDVNSYDETGDIFPVETDTEIGD
jgi:hypothetical protein